MSPDLTSFCTASANSRFACRYASQSVSSNVMSPGWSMTSSQRQQSIPASESHRLTVEQGPEDGVGEAIVVSLCHLGGEVHGDTVELGAKSFRHGLPIGFWDVEPCFNVSAPFAADVAWTVPGHPIHCRAANTRQSCAPQDPSSAFSSQ